MKIAFSKYHGAGNDFILINDLTISFPAFNRELISRLCHRQKGIGADGLILLQPSVHCDFRMRIFNADGKEAEMCGNGLRCLVHFLISLGINQNSFEIETADGPVRCHGEGERISTLLRPPRPLFWEEPYSMQGKEKKLYGVDTGVPHAVLFEEDVSGVDVEKWGREIRHHEKFAPRGVNVNFVQRSEKGELLVRTYERGVEGETLACGTGIAASAFVASKLYGLKSPIQVVAASKEILEVTLLDKEIEVKGPAVLVYNGELLI